MTKFAETEVLTDYIRSDSSFLWRQDMKTVLDDLGDLSDPRGTVYRMFEKLHMTTNKNVALLSQDSSFISRCAPESVEQEGTVLLTEDVVCVCTDGEISLDR